MTEHKDKLADDEKSAIEGSISQLEEAITQKDKQAIEKGMQIYRQLHHRLCRRFTKLPMHLMPSKLHRQVPVINSQAKGETIDAEFNENDDQDKK